MENENERDEYVLNDHGAIWRGSVSSSGPCNWNFGQFEEGILDATLHVLKMDARLQTPRGLNKLKDPVWLGRILSGTMVVELHYLGYNFFSGGKFVKRRWYLVGSLEWRMERR